MISQPRLTPQSITFWAIAWMTHTVDGSYLHSLVDASSLKKIPLVQCLICTNSCQLVDVFHPQYFQVLHCFTIYIYIYMVGGAIITILKNMSQWEG